MENQDRNLISSALRGGKPFKSYIKTILGRVCVTVWDSFENRPTEMILEGDPRKAEEGCIVDVWSAEEDYFFRNKPRNMNHMKEGVVISYVRSSEEKERTVEEYSDDELKAILNSKYFTILSVLNSTDSIAVLFRIKNLAQDMEKSDKLIKSIEGRIAEVQAEEFKPLPKVIDMEV